LELLVFLGIGVHGLTLRVRVLHFSLESAQCHALRRFPSAQRLTQSLSAGRHRQIRTAILTNRRQIWQI